MALSVGTRIDVIALIGEGAWASRLRLRANRRLETGKGGEHE